jgi:hypothetical protein
LHGLGKTNSTVHWVIDCWQLYHSYDVADEQWVLQDTAIIFSHCLRVFKSCWLPIEHKPSPKWIIINIVSEWYNNHRTGFVDRMNYPLKCIIDILPSKYPWKVVFSKLNANIIIISIGITRFSCSDQWYTYKYIIHNNRISIWGYYLDLTFIPCAYIIFLSCRVTKIIGLYNQNQTDMWSGWK